VEFVIGARKAAIPRTLEAVMGLEMYKPRLHALLSSRDLVNAFAFMFRRAISRASSWISRGILRAPAVVQHFALIEHASRSRFEARQSSVRPSCTVPLVGDTAATLGE
jgi:hypothetical protein